MKVVMRMPDKKMLQINCNCATNTDIICIYQTRYYRKM